MKVSKRRRFGYMLVDYGLNGMKPFKESGVVLVKKR
jgi:hypothetical protein